MSELGLRSLPPKVRITVAAVLTFFGTTAAIGAAWPFVEPWLPAHRQYVRDVEEEAVGKLTRSFAPTKIGMYELQISITKSRASSIRDRIVSMEIEAPKSDTQEELTKRRQQIESLKVELHETNEELKNLKIRRDKE